MLRLANLKGIFTGAGFIAKGGRHPTVDDCGFLAGPVDLICCPTTGRIVELMAPGSASELQATRTIDGSRLFATSGWIDSHTHAAFAGDRCGEFFARWAGRTYREISDAGGGIHRTIGATTSAAVGDLITALENRLRAMRRDGTVVVEVKSGYGSCVADEIRILEVIQDVACRADQPDIVSTFLGLHTVPLDRDRAEYVEAMITAISVVSERKLCRFVDAFPEQGFYTLDEAMRFLQAGKSAGLGIKIHADEITDMQASWTGVVAGAVSIDHLEHISDAAVRELSTSATVATLLPATSFFLGIGYANARRLIDAGARVALATDFNPGSAPAADMQLTMLLAASQLKMTAAEIFCAVTHNAAAALAMENQCGTLSPGMMANIALWRAPEKDLSSRSNELLEQIIVHQLTPAATIVKGQISEFIVA